MRNVKFPAIALMAAASIGGWMMLSYTRTAAADASDSTATALLVQFGVTDSEPRDWDGSVTCAGGEIVRLSNWRPRDEDVINGASWKLKTRRGPNFKRRDWEPQTSFSPVPYLLTPGVVIQLKANRGASLRFTTRNGAFSIDPSSLHAGRPMSFLNGAVTAELAPAAQLLTTKDYESDFASALAVPGGDLWVAWIGYRNRQDSVFVRRLSRGVWSNAEAVSELPGDIAFTKLGRDGKNGVWAVWSEQVGGNFDIYGRRFDGKSWASTVRLSEDPQPDLYPALATDSNGNLWLAWQGFRNGKSDIFARRYDGVSWSREERISTSPANDWEPAIAADTKGHVYIAWDTYDKGNYDVLMRRYENGNWSAPIAVAASPRFEAHISIACDAQDRLWAAWNYSGVQWGKDTGFLVKNGGTTLHEWRAVAVAVYANGAWWEPVSDFNAPSPESPRTYDDLPALQRDGLGRMWLFCRRKLSQYGDVPGHASVGTAAWEIVGSVYDGDRWSRPIQFPASAGRNDMRAGFASGNRGEIFAAWPTDNREYPKFVFQHADIYAAYLPSPDEAPKESKLKLRKEAPLETFEIHPREKEDLAKARSYAAKVNGETYRIYRGDTHRHTEMSMDGHNDGSLQECYRYALDAAGLDYLAVTDHNSPGGPDIDYINWLEQQAADLYFLPATFTPMYAYERSLRYPNGHRNVIFAERGNPTLPIPEQEVAAETGAGALYKYLRAFRGISTPHTSATNMGTDWRDNDPEVEPLVEIYQGDRISSEYEGAPKAANSGDPRSAPARVQPAGYLWNAWAKGYKLGVQAASDHISTHISFGCILSKDSSRKSLLDAMRRRHCYGATDNIVLDYRLQTGGSEYLQGDIVKSGGRVKLLVKVLGTAPIRQIDVIRSNRFVHTVQPMQPETAFTYEDNQPLAGESYYYVRVTQVDDQMAWSSPIWVRR